jgi:replicative DNA helicase
MESDKSVLLWLDSLSAFYDYQLDRQAELDAMSRGEVAARATLPWKALQKTDRGGFVSYLRPGAMVVIAADTSVGKTVAMECCAEHWARLGLQVAFFHLELPHNLMIDRRMCRHSGDPLTLIESGAMTPAMEAATARMLNWKGGINYVHCPGWSASQIVAKARQMHQRGQCDVLIADYFQKFRLAYRNGQNKADALGNAAEGIKTFLEQAGIPGMVGSQINRRADEFRRKQAKHIKGSGDIEDKANIVITMDRDILDVPVFDDQGVLLANKGDRSPEVRVRVDKNTNGPTGDAELVINGARFLMLDRSAPAPLVL